MAELQAHGLTIAAPTGWEGRIFRRAVHGEVTGEIVGAAAPMGEETFPVVHVATMSLPMDIADYGSDVVDDLGRDDALVVLKEFSPEDIGQPLFDRAGMPRRLRSGDFDRATLQRSLAGQAGYQAFFNEAGRAFCLYIVLGDYDRRAVVVPRLNEVLASVVIDPLEVDDSPTDVTEPSTSTTAPSEPTTTLPEEPPAEETTTTSVPAGDDDAPAPGES